MELVTLKTDSVIQYSNNRFKSNERLECCQNPTTDNKINLVRMEIEDSDETQYEEFTDFVTFCGGEVFGRRFAHNKYTQWCIENNHFECIEPITHLAALSLKTKTLDDFCDIMNKVGSDCKLYFQCLDMDTYKTSFIEVDLSKLKINSEEVFSYSDDETFKNKKIIKKLFLTKERSDFIKKNEGKVHEIFDIDKRVPRLIYNSKNLNYPFGIIVFDELIEELSKFDDDYAIKLKGKKILKEFFLKVIDFSEIIFFGGDKFKEDLRVFLGLTKKKMKSITAEPKYSSKDLPKPKFSSREKK